MNKELKIPEAAQTDTSSLEILRVWIANKEQHCSIRVGVWDDPAAWGIVLADLAQHVANSYAEDRDQEIKSIMTRIKNAFDSEISLPTDSLDGEVIDK